MELMNDWLHLHPVDVSVAAWLREAPEAKGMVEGHAHSDVDYILRMVRARYNSWAVSKIRKTQRAAREVSNEDFAKTCSRELARLVGEGGAS